MCFNYVSTLVKNKCFEYIFLSFIPQQIKTFVGPLNVRWWDEQGLVCLEQHYPKAWLWHLTWKASVAKRPTYPTFNHLFILCLSSPPWEWYSVRLENTPGPGFLEKATYISHTHICVGNANKNRYCNLIMRQREVPVFCDVCLKVEEWDGAGKCCSDGISDLLLHTTARF